MNDEKDNSHSEKTLKAYDVSVLLLLYSLEINMGRSYCSIF